MAVGQLWVREHLRSGAFTLHKVSGNDNPADLCTKYMSKALADHLLNLAGLAFEPGRAASAPRVSAYVEPLPSRTEDQLESVRRPRAGGTKGLRRAPVQF